MRRIRRFLTVALVLAPLSWPATPAHAQAPPACSEIEGFHKLDFWVGHWDVVDTEGRPLGTNRIEKILSGCAILEHWQGAGGGEGKSLFYFDHLGRSWKQVWITSRATAVGGVKEKRLVEELPDGSLRFQGAVTLPDGRTYLDRTTLTPLGEGRVRQVIEVSSDGGTNWRATFTGIYVPRAAS